ncbi:hypothetical protein ACFLWE_00515 [Chloroflexota bacterium]
MEAVELALVMYLKKYGGMQVAFSKKGMRTVGTGTRIKDQHRGF